MKKEVVSTFIDSMMGEISSEEKELAKKIIASSNLKEFKGYSEFFFAIIYPFNQFTSGFIKTTVADSEEVVFLMTQSQFVEAHFEKEIEKREGWQCSADKSSVIMKCLIEFYKTGKRIEFNYDQKYTYHLPKTVFKDHDSIISFFEGLHSLFYGNNTKYLQYCLSL
ncbi:MAG: hypothetical protein ACI86P_002713 [Flavobacteriales bacterium]|jgi:hypothetical protein